MAIRAVFLYFPLFALAGGCTVPSDKATVLPGGFVDLAEISPDFQYDLRYYTSNNFIGRPVSGYFAPRCIVTRQAAQALIQAREQASLRGFSLKVYDCYRPRQAVSDFVSWASDLDDILTKHRFYPAVPKDELFSRGYIAEQSGHSRGSTVDITLVPINSRQPAIDPFANRYDCRSTMAMRYPDNSIDMGSGYDCFDELSHTDNPAISATATQNRNLLRMIMEQAGFENYASEWWHYTLKSEPFADDYFDFPIN